MNLEEFSFSRGTFYLLVVELFVLLVLCTVVLACFDETGIRRESTTRSLKDPNW